jgi:hypothetical protein
MFGKNSHDMASTLDAMMGAAKTECRFDLYAAQRKVAEYVRQDRRFDNVGMSPDAIAKEAFEAKQAGRTMRLGPPAYETKSTPQTYTGR